MPPQDYFTDHDAGQATLGKTLGDISRKYPRYQVPIGPVDPMSHVAANATQENAVVKAFHQFRLQFPKEEAALLQKFQPPVVERARQMVQSG